MMWGYPFMGFGFGGWFMPVISIVVIGLIVWGIVALVRHTNKSNCCSPAQRNTALDILKRRYASGEISREQYEQLKKDLS